MCSWKCILFGSQWYPRVHPGGGLGWEIWFIFLHEAYHLRLWSRRRHWLSIQRFEYQQGWQMSLCCRKSEKALHYLPWFEESSCLACKFKRWVHHQEPITQHNCLTIDAKDSFWENLGAFSQLVHRGKLYLVSNNIWLMHTNCTFTVSVPNNEMLKSFCLHKKSLLLLFRQLWNEKQSMLGHAQFFVLCRQLNLVM